MLYRAKNPINNIMKNIKKYDKINYLDLVKLPILKPDSKKFAVPKPFLKELDKIGEQAISYMENVGAYKQFYESLPTKNKPPFINLTIGGVNRKTPPRNLFDDCSRGYITHLDKSHKIYVSKIFKKLGCDIEPDKVGIAPMRSKVALQHIFGLFKPGIVVAHKPNYKSTIDAAIINYHHTAVEVDVRDRYLALFKEVRKQAVMKKKKKK